MSLNYGSLAVQERFRDSLRDDGLEKLSAKHFPSMVVSTVGGTVSQSFNLRGFNSTIVEGVTSGLHGLIHAHAVLRRDASQDAIVVVAADEVAPILFQVFDKRGWLAPTASGSPAHLAAYGSESKGWLLGEGGVSLVVERAEKARARGARPLAKISGYGLTADGSLAPAWESSPHWHSEAIQRALSQSNLSADEIDLIYGHGRGQAAYDRREIESLNSVFKSRAVPLSNVMGNTGVAASSSGLMSVAAALLSLQHNEHYPVIGTSGDLVQGVELVRETSTRETNHVLVTGSTENGNNSAVVVSRIKE